MRYFTILLLLLVTSSAFSEEYSDYYYTAKIAKFMNMTIGGVVLLSAGVVGTAAGISMIASAGTASYQVTYNSDGTETESGDPVGGFGAVLASLGIPMTVGGIVLTAIGVKKHKEYKNEYEKKKSSWQLKVGVNSLALSYSF